jgi:hypothetical protein
MGERDVEVGRWATADVIRGQLTFGRDHVILRDRDAVDTVIALAAVAWARRSTDEL